MMAGGEQKLPYLLKLQAELEERLSTPQGPKAFLSALNREEITLYSPFDYLEAEEELKELKNLVGKIMSILHDPHIKAETREIILRSEQSGSLSPESFLATMQDSKLWKLKRDHMSPEEVHSVETFDSLITYENKFICALLDCIKDRLEALLSTLLPLLPSFESSVLNGSFDFGPYGLLNSIGNLELIDGILERKGEEEDFSKVYKKAEALLKKVKLIMNTEFYRLIHDERFPHRVLPTNILVHDRLYSFCYRYYQKHFFNRGEEIASEEAPYFNFVLLYILSFLVKSKDFTKRPSRPSFHLNEQGMLNFGPLTYHRDEFLYTISVDGPHQAIKVEVLAYGRVTATYYIVVRRQYTKAVKASLQSVYRELLVDADSITLLTAEDCLGEYKATVPFTYYKPDNATIIKNLFASFTLVFRGDYGLYKEKCPVCGKGHTRRSGNCYKCEDCHATYRLIPYKGAVWISGFRRS